MPCPYGAARAMLAFGAIFVWRWGLRRRGSPWRARGGSYVRGGSCVRGGYAGRTCATPWVDADLARFSFGVGGYAVGARHGEPVVGHTCAAGHACAVGMRVAHVRPLQSLGARVVTLLLGTRPAGHACAVGMRVAHVRPLQSLGARVVTLLLGTRRRRCRSHAHRAGFYPRSSPRWFSRFHPCCRSHR